MQKRRGRCRDGGEQRGVEPDLQTPPRGNQVSSGMWEGLRRGLGRSQGWDGGSEARKDGQRGGWRVRMVKER